MVVFDVVTDFCQFFTIVPYLPLFGEYDLIRQRAIDDGRRIVDDLSKESVLYVK